MLLVPRHICFSRTPSKGLGGIKTLILEYATRLFKGGNLNGCERSGSNREVLRDYTRYGLGVVNLEDRFFIYFLSAFDFTIANM